MAGGAGGCADAAGGGVSAIDASSEPSMTAMLAVVPCNDLAHARAFYERLGLKVASDHGDYLILTGHGTELHLTQAVEGWLVPGRNPFGLYLRTGAVDAVFAAYAGPAIHPPKAQPWGMYEFALNGPDNILVRVGWPARLRSA